MFNDDGLGQAMSIAYASDAALAAKEKVLELERNMIECAKRIMELEAKVSYLMRRDIENRNDRPWASAQ